MFSHLATFFSRITALEWIGFAIACLPGIIGLIWGYIVDRRVQRKLREFRMSPSSKMFVFQLIGAGIEIMGASVIPMLLVFTSIVLFCIFFLLIWLL